MNFPTSTHKNRWLFVSEVELEGRRCARYDKSVKEIELYKPDASTSTCVSMEEEKLLFCYYERMISKICLLYRFPRKILAISIVYFKRFFLNYSILDYDPWTVMITCVYLACKVENAYISAEELAKGVQQDARIVEKTVLGSEMNLLQGLEFELVVHTPYSAFDGFCFDLENFLQEDAKHSERWDHEKAEAFAERLRQKGYESIDALLFSDGPLLYAPGLLAYAAFEMAMKASKEGSLLGDYLSSVLKRKGMLKGDGDGGEEKRLRESIDLIHKLGQKGSKFSIEESVLKTIDKKLKKCRNPVYDPTSEQYKKKQAEKQKLKMKAKATLKRSAVAQDAQALGMSEADQDLFFPENKQESNKRRKSSPIQENKNIALQ
jgi:cyclin H